ncbi:hypothetical protein JCM1393_15860 [Clostridium carnis]
MSGKKNRKAKKYGFTIVELISVIAIIGILAGILIPNVTSYMRDSKKVEVKSQARELVVAVEAIRFKNSVSISDDETIASIKSEGNSQKISEINHYIGNIDDLQKIFNLKISDAKKVVSGSHDFEINGSGEYLGLIE